MGAKKYYSSIRNGWGNIGHATGVDSLQGALLHFGASY